MRFLIGLALVAVLLLIAAVATGFIDVDQTRTAQLPTIKAEGGQLPGFDVKSGNVAVGTTNATVEVPTVDATERTVEVPKVEVNKPKQ